MRLNLGVGLALIAIGVDDRAHDEPEDEPEEDGRDQRVQRVQPVVFDHTASLRLCHWESSEKILQERSLRQCGKTSLQEGDDRDDDNHADESHGHDDARGAPIHGRLAFGDDADKPTDQQVGPDSADNDPNR